jgi:hypothetical protein
MPLPDPKVIADGIVSMEAIANATLAAAKMPTPNTFTFWDLLNIILYLMGLKSGSQPAVPTPVEVPTPESLGNDANHLDSLVLMLQGVSQAAKMPDIKDAATDTRYRLADLPEWVAENVVPQSGITPAAVPAAVPASAPAPAPVIKPGVAKPVTKPVTKPSPAPLKKPAPKQAKKAPLKPSRR